jgi:hypothetical protein
MFIVVQIQRVITCASGAFLAVVVTLARHEVAPGLPPWQTVVRLAYVFGPWLLSRWIATSLIWMIRPDRPTRSSRIFAFLRNFSWLPSVYITALMAFYLVYFVVFWVVPVHDSRQVGDLYGHLAVFMILVPVGIAFGLLELSPSADTMTQLWPFRPGFAFVPTHQLPAHAGVQPMVSTKPQGSLAATHTHSRPRHARRRGFMH